MDRRSVIFLPFFLAACSKPARSALEMLPAMAGAWKRGEVKSPAEVPGAAAALGVIASAEAIYESRGTVRIRVLQFKSETSAFEAMQKWRQTDGLAAYKGPYFFIAQSTSVEAAMELLALLQKAAAA